MDKGIYTALSGGIAKSHELELIANNLANVNTPGFKRDTGTFNEYLMELRRPDTAEALTREIEAATLMNGRVPGDKSFVEMDGIYTDYRQGVLNSTGGGLDLALHGKGFFEVLTPEGVRYTRQGNFSISNKGELVNKDGYPVLAKSDEPLPEQRTIKLNQGANGVGPLSITPDGSIYRNNTKLAQLSVQEFQENQWLEKSGNSYYENIDPRNLSNGIETKVRQGFLEGSNVDPVLEMTRLIKASRAYEAHMQTVKTYQEIDSKTVNEIARETA